MEEITNAIQLSVRYKEEDMFFEGPKKYESQFGYGNKTYSILIEQLLVRDVYISSNKFENTEEIVAVFRTIEWLLMLFDGKFYKIEKIEIIDIDNEPSKFEKITKNLLLKRLSFYKTADFNTNPPNKLLDLFDTDSIDICSLFPIWTRILDELDIAHPSFLYNTSNIELPVDCKIASIIQIFEPLSELIEVFKSDYNAPKNKKGESKLKLILISIIEKYGQYIFNKEQNIDETTQLLVNSRNRIFHIKRKFERKCLTANQCILYLAKLSLLYRVVIFDLLGISEDLYSSKLHTMVDLWDKWYNNINT